MAMRSELTLSEVLPELIRQRNDELADRRVPFLDWSMRVPEPKTGTLNFNRWPFQKELYTEGADDPEVVVKKATQVGVSTYLLRWAMFWADVRAYTALYVFPKRQQMYDFADARIKAAILVSEYLSARIPHDHVNNKGLKRVGAGYLYCRGSESKDDLQSVDADVLVLDEYDDIRPENIPDAERRLSGSDIGYVRRVGVPSRPGKGLDRLYKESDMRQWFVKCGSCNLKQPLSYEANVDEDAVAIVCANCRKPMDVRDGEWVAEKPNRDVRGYHISRLIVFNTNLRKIIAAHHKTIPFEVKAHHNKDLGLAYQEPGGGLTAEDIQAAQRAELPRIAPPFAGSDVTTMGVDVASVRALHVRVSKNTEDNRQIPLYVGEVDNFGEVAKLMDRYDVKMAIVDHLPEGRLAMQLAEKYPGRVYLGHFGNHPEVLKVKPELRSASVRRVAAIDTVFQGIREQRRLLPGDLPEDYSAHLEALQRVAEEDPETGVKTVVYEGSVGQPFDFAMAEVYDMLAREVWLWKMGTEAAEVGETERMEDTYDFERSTLDAGTKRIEERMEEYEPGFGDGDDEYMPGFED